MLTLLYVPLDERPCNLTYPLNALAVNSQLTYITLPKSVLGYKKKAADVNMIWKFVIEHINSADAAVLSSEMLLYGGLLPSRIHQFSSDQLVTYEKNLRELKKQNPEKKLYMSNLIMRTPRYNGGDEEPDYYEEYGEKIFRYGWLKDKRKREELTKLENQELANISQTVPTSYISNYEARREFNITVNLLNIRLVEEGVIDFLAVPQDDSALYGYTAIDQRKVYETIYDKNLKDRIMVYPGADEVGFTLLARAFNEYKNRKPKVFVQFSSTLGPNIVPLYEDRIIKESLKAHVVAAGMQLTNDEMKADYYLTYNTPGKIMQESWDQFENRDITYDSYRHLLTFVESIKAAVKRGAVIGVCDSAYANGGDLELIRILDKQQLLEKISVYKGWNTNCNSLGSTLASMTFIDSHSNITDIYNNLLSNIFEDVFYQTIVRNNLTKNLLPKLNCDYFHLYSYTDQVLEGVYKQFLELNDKYLAHTLVGQSVELQELSFPWNRMFEINCQLKLTKGE